MSWTCPGCGKANAAKANFCAACGVEHGRTDAPQRAQPPALPTRATYLEPRDHDTVCRLHSVPLDPTGFCPTAQAWWTPRFRCPHCAGPLWDNGFCSTCTPKRQTFPGDYFECRWEEGSGREWGHYVKVYAGPTAVPTQDEIAGYLAELRAIPVGRDVSAREPGDELEADVVPF